MRTTMKVLAAVVLFTAACGGTDYSKAGQSFRLDGNWQIWTGSTPADAALIGNMAVAPDLASGSYVDGSGSQALTAHTFGAGPDFSLAFGSKTVTGTLLDGDSHSNVFKGTVGAQAVTGVITSR